MRPHPGVIAGRIEELALHREAPACFADGRFIATVLVAAALVEQTIVQELLDCGLTADARRSSFDAIKLARDHGVFGTELLDQCGSLMKLRNAYAHLREPSHDTSFSARFVASHAHPDLLRESDAQMALLVMDEVFYAAMKPGAIGDLET